MLIQCAAPPDQESFGGSLLAIAYIAGGPVPLEPWPHWAFAAVAWDRALLLARFSVQLMYADERLIDHSAREAYASRSLFKDAQARELGRQLGQAAVLKLAFSGISRLGNEDVKLLFWYFAATPQWCCLSSVNRCSPTRRLIQPLRSGRSPDWEFQPSLSISP